MAWGEIAKLTISRATSFKLGGRLLAVASWSDSMIAAGTLPGLAAANYGLRVNNGLVAGFVVA